MGRIVVGIDGSEHSQRALRWAAGEAKLRGSTLHVVHSWTFPAVSARRSELDAPPRVDLEAAAKRVLDEACAILGESPGVEIQREVAYDPAARALIRASEGAELLVVGSRGTGGFRGLRLGSVSHQCALHSRCPVVIIPAEGGSGDE